MTNNININYNIVTWAIARAGYDLDEFVLSFPKFRVFDWLEQKRQPTLKQLIAFADKVHIPFGYLFLSEPPIETLPIPFFRTGKKNATGISVNVYDTINIIQQRQDWLKEYLAENQSPRLPFVGSFNKNSDYKKVVADIRQTLGLKEHWAREFSTWKATLDFLSERIEEIGITLMFNGVVENNTHRPLDVNEVRGFVMVDDIAPFMFINAADGKAAQMFTIIHELAHIWVGESAGFDIKQLLPADDPIELFCDKVAAEFLVPEQQLKALWPIMPKDYKRLSKEFKVSAIVVARRALDLGLINKDNFFKFYNAYVSELAYVKEQQASGGNFYATTKKRLSKTFLNHVNQAVKENKLLYRDAYKLTSLKGDTFQKLFKEHFFD